MNQDYLNKQKAEAMLFAARAADWRNGALIYQIIVDRFEESAHLNEKMQYYAHPRQLRKWSETPTPGKFLPTEHVWSHEIDFWGGDLKSLGSRIDYLKDLEIDVLYLNPIHAASTNHKYDATDYMQISPEYGTRADLIDLINTVHKSNLKIVLDGVFNHMGRQSDIFQQASSSLDNPYRDWFYFSDQFSQGVRLWSNAESLPELNYENPAVRKYIYEDENSVIRSYLRDGIDGWRLDTAFELGYQYLFELTNTAHHEKPGSLVVGEIWNYPKDWFPALDSVMNFTLRQIILDTVNAKIAPKLASDMIAKMIEDTGIEEMLKSWILLDNHDVKRISTSLPDRADQRIAQVLQFTLPGSPNLYYGSELGMQGADDPCNRAPMRWDLLNEQNEVYRWTKKLIHLRKESRALKIGDYRKLLSDKLIAFERCTEKVDETLLIIVNPSDQVIKEMILVPDSKLMNATKLVDLLGTEKLQTIHSGLLSIEIAPKSALLLKPQTAPEDGYSPFKRIA